jgi:hypothetical protein
MSSGQYRDATHGMSVHSPSAADPDVLATHLAAARRTVQRIRGPLSQGGVWVEDFEVRCQHLHVPQKCAPVGPLSPRAIFLRLIARMAMVAAVRFL